MSAVCVLLGRVITE